MTTTERVSSTRGAPAREAKVAMSFPNPQKEQLSRDQLRVICGGGRHEGFVRPNRPYRPESTPQTEESADEAPALEAVNGTQPLSEAQLRRDQLRAIVGGGIVTGNIPRPYRP